MVDASLTGRLLKRYHWCAFLKSGAFQNKLLYQLHRLPQILRAKLDIARRHVTAAAMV
jgi:hypothetical protein